MFEKCSYIVDAEIEGEERKGKRERKNGDRFRKSTRIPTSFTDRCVPPKLLRIIDCRARVTYRSLCGAQKYEKRCWMFAVTRRDETRLDGMGAGDRAGKRKSDGRV